MAGFMSSPSLGFTSTVGAFIGGAARGLNDQIAGEKEEESKQANIRAAKVDAVNRERKKENDQLDKQSAFYDYLIAQKASPEDIKIAMYALRAGALPSQIHITPGGSNPVTSAGTNSEQSKGSTDLDGITDPIQAAAIVKDHESNGDYYAGYNLKGNNPLKDSPVMPGYYGFPQWGGNMGPKGISHAAGAHGFEPDTWKTYAGQVSQKLGRNVDWHNPADQDAVFDAAWSAEGKAPWAPYWTNGQKSPNTRQAQNQPQGGYNRVPSSQTGGTMNLPQVPDYSKGFAEGGDVDPSISPATFQQPNQEQPSSPQPSMEMNAPQEFNPPPQQAQPPAQMQPQGQMSDADNDIRNPAVQQQMPAGTQTADVTLGNHNPGSQLADQFKQQQIEHMKREDENMRQQRQQQILDRELKIREFNEKLLQKPATPEDSLNQNVQEDDIKKYFHDTKTGLQARYNALPDLRAAAMDTNSIMDNLNNGFKASATTEAADNLNRFTMATLGLNMKDLGFENVNDQMNVNTFRKNLANAVIERLKTLHFGRITNYEAGIVRSGFAAETNDPDTNLKITLAMQHILNEALEGTNKIYGTAYNINGSVDPRYPAGIPSNKTAGAARVMEHQLSTDYNKEQAPWQQLTDKDQVPENQWFEDKKTQKMHYFANGKLYNAGDKIQ